jgi:hypothetical protein
MSCGYTGAMKPHGHNTIASAGMTCCASGVCTAREYLPAYPHITRRR